MINKKICNKDDLKFYIKEDAKANGMDCGFFTYIRYLLSGIEGAYVVKYLKCLRKAEYYYNNREKGSLYRILYAYYKLRFQRLGFKNHIQIEINRVGYGCRIIHLSGGGGVIVSAEKVENYCSFNSGVVIGKKRNKRPVIGDYVAFGPGSYAFGDITIGSNSFIAPGAVVLISVPENSIVGGIPAKILKKK